MTRTEAEKNAQKRYREKYARATITIPKSKYKIIKKYAEQHGESFNTYAQRALWDMMSYYNTQDTMDMREAETSVYNTSKQIEALEKRAYEASFPYD